MKKYSKTIKSIISVTVVSLFILNCGKSEDKAATPLSTTSTVSSESSANSGIKWHSFNEGLKLAKAEKKHIILDFYADWCKWCKVMDEKTFSDQEVISELSKNFISIRIHTDKPDKEKISFKNHKFSSSDFASALGIEGLPTVVFMDEQGNLITRIPGYVDKGIILPVLGYMTKKCYTQQISIDDYVQGRVPCETK